MPSSTSLMSKINIYILKLIHVTFSGTFPLIQKAQYPCQKNVFSDPWSMKIVFTIQYNWSTKNEFTDTWSTKNHFADIAPVHNAHASPKINLLTHGPNKNFYLLTHGPCRKHLFTDPWSRKIVFTIQYNWSTKN